MPKTIEHCHWPDAPDMWMPFAPAIKARGFSLRVKKEAASECRRRKCRARSDLRGMIR